MNNLPNLNNCTIALIGLGYVGLPLATEFALKKKSILDNSKLKRKIIGFDINHARIENLKKFIDVTKEIDSDTLKKTTNIFFTSDAKDLSKADVYIVTVPTPIDQSKNQIFIF